MVRYSAWYVTDDDMLIVRFFFFFNDTATTEIYTLSLHDALPIYAHQHRVAAVRGNPREPCLVVAMPERDEMAVRRSEEHTSELQSPCNLVCRLLLEKKNISSRPRFLHPESLTYQNIEYLPPYDIS